MAEKSWPWLDVAGDRTVTAAMVKQANADAGFIGVVSGLTPAKSGATVNVAAGTAMINGVCYVLDAEQAVTPAAGTRKDYVVLRYTAASRTIALAVLQGTASEFPTLTKTDAVYELAIASIDNSGGAFTVADTRSDATLCGRATRVETGIGTIATLPANGTASQAVTFAKAFGGTPNVVVSVETPNPNKFWGSVTGASTTGFTAYAGSAHNASVAIRYMWIAVGPIG